MKKVSSFESETFFEISCIVPFSFCELWNWFCFEKGALGIQTLKESARESTFRIFFENRPNGGAKKLVEIFQLDFSIYKNIEVLDESIKHIENWQSNWNQHFTPIEIGKSLIVLPPWEIRKNKMHKHPIWINPGQAFGTGTHISTVLALEKLEKYLLKFNQKPKIMLDIGIGSGILSIAACRLGVKNVKGVDLDEKTKDEVRKNVELNYMKGRIKVIVGQPFLIKDPAPLVVCNMLLSEILLIKDDLFRLTCPKGILICSGILKVQEYELREAMSKLGFNFCSSKEKQKWVAISFKRIK